MTDRIIQVANIAKENHFSNPQIGRVYSPTGISPTIDAMGGGDREPKIIASSPSTTISSFRHNNIVIENMEKEDFDRLTREQQKLMVLPPELKDKKFRIRKLTPRECFRLMGVDDKDIDKIQAYPYESLIEHPAYSKAERFRGVTEKEKRAAMKRSVSNSAQYKLAGNSIVVDVLFHIFRKMFIEK